MQTQGSIPETTGVAAVSAKDPAMFRPADIILAIGLIVIGFAMSFFLAFGRDDGAQVKATVAGKPYGVYNLSEDQTITIRQGSHENVFEIKDGSARMIRANCHGHDCMQESAISRSGETIVCLPHKIVLEVTGGEEDFDVVSK